MKKFESLKNTADFGRAYQRGKSYGNRVLVMYIFDRGRDQASRVGISVSKKVGNSVIRHLIKRRLKECFRSHLNWWKDGYDIVIVARQMASLSSYQELLSALRHAGTHLDIFIEE